MPSCVADFQPIIIAVATVISIQIPILIASLASYFKAKSDNSHSKARQYEQIKKLDDLTLITKNGFHGPPGKQGPAGEQGIAGKDGINSSN